MRRDLFMEKLNPENFSQRLQDLNKYLDYIPIERTTMADKTQKAYGKLLPDDEIRSIMGRAIPPEWTVNLLALSKEPWRFKDLEGQLNMYLQQWQADQQKQIIAKMAGNGGSRTRDQSKLGPGLVKKIADLTIFNQSTGKSGSYAHAARVGMQNHSKSKPLLHLTSVK
jgi:hypothetical protein